MVYADILGTSDRPVVVHLSFLPLLKGSQSAYDFLVDFFTCELDVPLKIRIQTFLMFLASAPPSFLPFPRRAVAWTLFDFSRIQFASIVTPSFLAVYDRPDSPFPLLDTCPFAI